MKKLNIVQIIHSVKDFGGAETFIIDLTLELIKQGHNVTLISFYKERGFYNKVINDNNIPTIYLNKHKGPDLKTALILRRLLKKIKPDIVHSHTNTNLTYFLGRITNIKGISFVETIHTSYVSKAHNWLLKRIIKKSYVSRKVFPVAISSEVNNYANQYFGRNLEAEIILNGINLPDNISSENFKSRPFDFITVSRLDEVKNHLSLIKATKILADKGYNFSISIVGDGPMKNIIYDEVKNNNLEKYVNLLGLRTDIFDLLQQHKVFVLPSFWEGNPIALLEAMACNLSVIATNVGGTVDIIDHNSNGLLIDPNNYHSLADAMEKTLTDPDFTETSAQKNLQLSKKYSIETTAKDYVSLYKKILSKKFKRE